MFFQRVRVLNEVKSFSRLKISGCQSFDSVWDRLRKTSGKNISASTALSTQSANKALYVLAPIQY
jgi:hypothetical protein